MKKSTKQLLVVGGIGAGLLYFWRSRASAPVAPPAPPVNPTVPQAVVAGFGRVLDVFASPGLAK